MTLLNFNEAKLQPTVLIGEVIGCIGFLVRQKITGLILVTLIFNAFGEASGTMKSQRFLLVRLLDTLHFGDTTEQLCLILVRLNYSQQLFIGQVIG
jgi:hypothetical protein